MEDQPTFYSLLCRWLTRMVDSNTLLIRHAAAIPTSVCFEYLMHRTRMWRNLPFVRGVFWGIALSAYNYFLSSASSKQALAESPAIRQSGGLVGQGIVQQIAFKVGGYLKYRRRQWDECRESAAQQLGHPELTFMDSCHNCCKTSKELHLDGETLKLSLPTANSSAFSLAAGEFIFPFCPSCFNKLG